MKKVVAVETTFERDAMTFDKWETVEGPDGYDAQIKYTKDGFIVIRITRPLDPPK